LGLGSAGDGVDPSGMVNTVQLAGHNPSIVGSNVGLQLSVGLVEPQGIGVAVEVAFDGGDVLAGLVGIAVFVYDVDYAFYHLLLCDFASDARVVR